MFMMWLRHAQMSGDVAREPRGWRPRFGAGIRMLRRRGNGPFHLKVAVSRPRHISSLVPSPQTTYRGGSLLSCGSF